MLHAVNPDYLPVLLRLQGLANTPVGDLFQIPGFDDFNSLIKVNSVFSSRPKFWPVDRTQRTANPLRLEIYRPWTVPTVEPTLDQALESRAQELLCQGKIINVFWSGGIDSTAMVTALVQHAPCRDQLRVLFSPWSTYEHPGYIQWLIQRYPDLEVIDTSGDIYLEKTWDGIYVTGEGGDELCASLDQTFFDRVGWQQLHRPWQDYFQCQIGLRDDPVIDWFQQHCSVAGRSIETLLQARWWFYAICKSDSILRELKVYLALDHHDHCDPHRVVAFFDCDGFLSWAYHNVDDLIATDQYASYKKALKQYCYQHDGFYHWYQNKIKHNSSQINLYYKKRSILQDHRWLAINTQGRVLTSTQLPFINRQEYLDLTAHEEIFNTAG